MIALIGHVIKIDIRANKVVIIMKEEIENFWMNLNKIQAILLKSDKEFATYLGINYSQFSKKKATADWLPLNAVFECAEKLNFHFNDLLQKNFSIDAILSHVQGKTALLDKYSIAPYSKTRQTVNVLNYLAQSRGERAKINLLRKFQLSDDFILNSNQDVNIHLFIDIVKYMGETHGLTQEEFFQVGRMTPFTSINTDIQQELKDKRNCREMMEFLFSNSITERFDRNFLYKIESLNDEYAIIEARPNKLVMEELRVRPKEFGSEDVCLTRMGVFSSLPWFKYKHYSQVTKISSIYAGGNTNFYKMDLSRFKNLSCLPGASGNSRDFQAIYH